MKTILIFSLIVLNFSASKLDPAQDFETTLDQSTFAGYVIFDAAGSPDGKYWFMVKESFKGRVMGLLIDEKDLLVDVEHGEECLLICENNNSIVTKVYYLLSKDNALPKSSIEALTNLPCFQEIDNNEKGFCTKENNPVCGCNNKTYGNLCFLRKAGILKFKAGDCP